MNHPAPSQTSRPLIGIGVLIWKGGRVLLGKRRGSHGDGTWAPPGGHLEFGETVDECARREVREETGLELAAIREGPWTNDVFEREAKHYVTLFVLAGCPVGEPEIREPMKCEGWQWFPWDALPGPLFQPLATLRKRGYDPDE